MKIKLTKTGFDVGGTIMPPRFGSLPQGHEITVDVADELGESDGRIRARAMLMRSHPTENSLEWTVEVVGRACETCGAELEREEIQVEERLKPVAVIFTCPEGHEERTVPA